jgi:hydroxymethylpyrimidine/phosphomethylpyrimidine kinase
LKSGENFFPVAMTIAGSDSGGGAGVQADLRTFAALGVFGTSAITALTAQNPREVRGIFPVSPGFLESQLDAVFAKFAVRATKTGMLFNAENVKLVSKFMKRRPGCTLVVDPVMVSTSGARLLREDAVDAIKEELFPLASWMTPNVEEAELIIGRKISSLSDAVNAAIELSRRWNCSCVIKGGHRIYRKGWRTDIVVCGEGGYLMSAPDLDVSACAAHGTGCTFSAALAANFAKGAGDLEALKSARSFVQASLIEKVHVGRHINAMFPPRKEYHGEVELCKIQ